MMTKFSGDWHKIELTLNANTGRITVDGDIQNFKSQDCKFWKFCTNRCNNFHHFLKQFVPDSEELELSGSFYVGGLDYMDPNLGSSSATLSPYRISCQQKDNLLWNEVLLDIFVSLCFTTDVPANLWSASLRHGFVGCLKVRTHVLPNSIFLRKKHHSLSLYVKSWLHMNKP